MWAASVAGQTRTDIEEASQGAAILDSLAHVSGPDAPDFDQKQQPQQLNQDLPTPKCTTTKQNAENLESLQ